MNERQNAVRYACRGTRHWMAHVAPRGDWRRPEGTAWYRAWSIMHFECQRPGCEVWRHDAINRYGELLARCYDYPGWYGLDTDEERPTAAELRLWMIRHDDELSAKRARRRSAG